jgi:lipoyl-dependent peroxiredoxin
MKRQATAVWNGAIREGKGTVSTESGVLSDSQYSFSTRFENGTGTNPEELLGAAHAGCFSMALSLFLGQAGLTPENINTTASVRVGKNEVGFVITDVHLDVTAKIPGASQEQFAEIANQAKTNCLISKALSIPVTIEAKLEN